MLAVANLRLFAVASGDKSMVGILMAVPNGRELVIFAGA